MTFSRADSVQRPPGPPRPQWHSADTCSRSPLPPRRRRHNSVGAALPLVSGATSPLRRRPGSRPAHGRGREPAAGRHPPASELGLGNPPAGDENSVQVVFGHRLRRPVIASGHPITDRLWVAAVPGRSTRAIAIAVGDSEVRRTQHLTCPDCPAAADLITRPRR